MDFIQTSPSFFLPQTAEDIPVACWWRTGWVAVSWRVHQDYRPGTGNCPEPHKAPYWSLTTMVAVHPRSGPWLVAAEMRRTSTQCSQSRRKLLTSFCFPWTSECNKYKTVLCLMAKKMEKNPVNAFIASKQLSTWCLSLLRLSFTCQFFFN